MARQELTWQTIDTTTLTGELMEKYEDYLSAKGLFEQAMESVIGCSLAFSYKRGELSIAKVERKVAKGKVSLASLADFLKDKASNGERA